MEAGTYTFEVATMPCQVAAGDFLKWQFEFKVAGSQDKPFKMGFFDNQMGELLSALGFKQIEEGVFDWDSTDAYGKSFKAELFYEEDRNGKINEYTKKIQTYRKLRSFEAVLTPAMRKKNEPKPQDIAWEE